MTKKSLEEITHEGIMKVKVRFLSDPKRGLVEIVETPLITLLKRIFEREASKVLRTRGEKERRRLSSTAKFAAAMIEAKVLEPEDAVDYVVKKFQRDQKKQKKDLSRFYGKEDFYLYEVAEMINSSVKTVQRHIKAGNLKQQEGFYSKIKKSELLKFLKKMGYTDLYTDFNTYTYLLRKKDEA